MNTKKTNLTPREWSRLDEPTRDLIRGLQVERPVNLARLAKSLGLRVKLGTLPTGKSGSIQLSEGELLIRLNRDESRQRQRFTLAHEIAHALLHRHVIEDLPAGIVDNAVYRSGASEQIEFEANRLAAEILMPWSAVQERVQELGGDISDEDIETLATEFGVSVPAMEIRLSSYL